MRINNVDEKTSFQLSVVFVIVVISYVVLYALLYKSSEAVNFFEWVKTFFDALNNSDFEMKICLLILTVFAPLGAIIGLISSLINRQIELKNFNEDLNIKYVDLRPERVDFVFTQSQYNFTCGYEDIEKLKMNIETICVHTKNGTQIVVKEIDLSFHVLNGKIFELTNTTVFPMKFCYKIADYAQRVRSFSYNFSGYGELDTLKESLDDYLKTGYKQILPTQMEDAFKWMSIVFFSLFVFFTCSFSDIIMYGIDKGDLGLLSIFSPFIIFLIFTLILDIMLILDKINDKKYGVDHKSKELIGKIPHEFIIILEIIVTIIIGFIILRPILFTINDHKILKVENGFQELRINPLSELNGLRKDEIYSYRKAYVKDSLFASDNYEPNEKVFGQIQDYKPWWGTRQCQPFEYSEDYHENIEGVSKQSLQINNPNALVGLNSPYILGYNDRDEDFCNSEYSKFIPNSLKYNKEKNLIVVEYEVSESLLTTYAKISNINVYYPIQLSGLNALDFGYKYVYAFNTKYIKMFDKDKNITKNIEIFRDYIHLGRSCKYEGGCNNISPIQNDKIILVRDLPAEINLKLWKKPPKDKYSKPDMYYRIIFKKQ